MLADLFKCRAEVDSLRAALRHSELNFRLCSFCHRKRKRLLRIIIDRRRRSAQPSKPVSHLFSFCCTRCIAKHHQHRGVSFLQIPFFKQLLQCLYNEVSTSPQQELIEQIRLALTTKKLEKKILSRVLVLFDEKFRASDSQQQYNPEEDQGEVDGAAVKFYQAFSSSHFSKVSRHYFHSVFPENPQGMLLLKSQLRSEASFRFSLLRKLLTIVLHYETLPILETIIKEGSRPLYDSKGCFHLALCSLSTVAFSLDQRCLLQKQRREEIIFMQQPYCGQELFFRITSLKLVDHVILGLMAFPHDHSHEEQTGTESRKNVFSVRLRAIHRDIAVEEQFRERRRVCTCEQLSESHMRHYEESHTRHYEESHTRHYEESHTRHYEESHMRHYEESSIALHGEGSPQLQVRQGQILGLRVEERRVLLRWGQVSWAYEDCVWEGVIYPYFRLVGEQIKLECLV